MDRRGPREAVHDHHDRRGRARSNPVRRPAPAGPTAPGRAHAPPSRRSPTSARRRSWTARWRKREQQPRPQRCRQSRHARTAARRPATTGCTQGRPIAPGETAPTGHDDGGHPRQGAATGLSAKPSDARAPTCPPAPGSRSRPSPSEPASIVSTANPSAPPKGRPCPISGDGLPHGTVPAPPGGHGYPPANSRRRSSADNGRSRWRPQPAGRPGRCQARRRTGRRWRCPCPRRPTPPCRCGGR